MNRLIKGRKRKIFKTKSGKEYYVSKGKKVYFGNTKRKRESRSISSNPGIPEQMVLRMRSDALADMPRGRRSPRVSRK